MRVRSSRRSERRSKSARLLAIRVSTPGAPSRPRRGRTRRHRVARRRACRRRARARGLVALRDAGRDRRALEPSLSRRRRRRARRPGRPARRPPARARRARAPARARAGRRDVEDDVLTDATRMSRAACLHRSPASRAAPARAAREQTTAADQPGTTPSPPPPRRACERSCCRRGAHRGDHVRDRAGAREQDALDPLAGASRGPLGGFGGRFGVELRAPARRARRRRRGSGGDAAAGSVPDVAGGGRGRGGAGVGRRGRRGSRRLLGPPRPLRIARRRLAPPVGRLLARRRRPRPAGAPAGPPAVPASRSGWARRRRADLDVERRGHADGAVAADRGDRDPIVARPRSVGRRRAPPVLPSPKSQL